MQPIITKEDLRSFAYCNDHLCHNPVRGIVVSFMGLGNDAMHSADIAEGLFYADRDVLFLAPYQNPWAWMNPQTVALTDELVDVLFDAFDLPSALPIVSTGLSMGGQSALLYTLRAKRTPVACVVNCPVCDMVYHYSERKDLPRTMYSAFGTCDGTLEEVLRRHSPLHLVEQMPLETAYHIFHCEEDTLVNKQRHSDLFVKAMEKQHRISYYSVPARGHCDLPEDVRHQFTACVWEAIEENTPHR